LNPSGWDSRESKSNLPSSFKASPTQELSVAGSRRAGSPENDTVKADRFVNFDIQLHESPPKKRSPSDINLYETPRDIDP